MKTLNNKTLALVEFLGYNSEEAENLMVSSYDSNIIEDDRQEYLVLTDEEADEYAANYIKDTIWAFNASFIAHYVKAPIEAVEAIQANDRCESNNDLFIDWIEEHNNMDEFIADAISSDGRGYFISSYDGDENEIKVDGEWYYIYRIN